ncbi:MAG: hypothetical protein SVX43_22635, partial [Cyanobacteriota bacterium]|nr:hypothetical protein [Cyanobacteriota bacterium]
NLSLTDKNNLFSKIAEIQPSDYLEFTLNYNLPLASEINTEKARSEMIIAPILLEVRRKVGDRISLFSGREFNVAPEQGLNGACDFLLGIAESQLVIGAPVVAIVEAKKENLIGGLGQCAAEMIAAQMFNDREGNLVKTIYGAVTSGTVWRFLKLDKKMMFVDIVEYYINDLKKILGILVTFVS